MDIKEPGHVAEAPHDLRSIAVDHTSEPDEGARDPTDLAIDVWRGIVVGRWTLIDHFQKDGRQYLVARRCRTGGLRPKRLTRRECEVAANAIRGYSNKMIGYRLGIAETTVATHLRRALAKLGIQSRTDLIRLLPKEAFETEGDLDTMHPTDLADGEPPPSMAS